MPSPKIPSTTSGSVWVICPFFVAHGDRCIICQGLIPDQKYDHVRFETDDKKELQKKHFCEGVPAMCPRYVAIRHFHWDDPDED